MSLSFTCVAACNWRISSGDSEIKLPVALVCWLIVFCLHVDLCVDEASDAEAGFMWAAIPVALTSGDLTEVPQLSRIHFPPFSFNQHEHICFVSLSRILLYSSAGPLDSSLDLQWQRLQGKSCCCGAPPQCKNTASCQQWGDTVFAYNMHSTLWIGEVRFPTWISTPHDNSPPLF